MKRTISNLPMLPPLVFEVEKLYKNNSSISRLSQAASEDPALKEDVLHVTNTKLFDLPGRVNDLQRAISLLGQETFYGIVLHHSVRKVLHCDLSLYGAEYEKILQTLILQNEFVHHWCGKFYKSYENAIAKLTLISEIGKFGLAKCLKQKRIDSTPLIQAKSFQKLQKAEEQLLGINSETAAGLMLEKWGLFHEERSVLQSFEKEIKRNHLGYETIEMQAKIFHVIKTCTNIKEHHTKNSIRKASEIANKYGLEGFDESIYSI